MMLPIAEMPTEVLRGLKFILTDIDDTITLHGRLPAVAYQALQDLHNAGLKVIPITGRSAGWCDHIARMWPVDSVVGENGGFIFRYDHAQKKMQRIYAQSMSEREENRLRLNALAELILARFPGTALASDQAYRDIDVAIDFCEDVPLLPLHVAQEIADVLIATGANAKVSSIHVNAWFGQHDKLTTSLRLLQEVYDVNIENEIKTIAYCGDSPNDAPMFARIPESIGVANLRPLAHLMSHLPRYITEGDGGIGFAEFARAVLAARR
jgi:HAD superfamily hydrolase (TIGR01484 family)